MRLANLRCGLATLFSTWYDYGMEDIATKSQNLAFHMIFFENIWIWFGLAFIVGAVGYYIFLNDRQIRTLGITASATVAVLLLGLALTYFIDTDRKSITRMLNGLAATIERDDLDGILDHYIAPRANQTRVLASGNMGLVRVTGAQFRDLKFEVNRLTSPPTAQVSFTATIHWVSRNLADFPSERPIPQIVNFNIELEQGPNGSWLVTDKCEFRPTAVM